MNERRVRRELRVFGTVQGVGFRPFVFALANDLSLSGFVLNDDLGVLIEAEGAPVDLEAFSRRLRDEAPVLAVIERIEQQDLAPRAEKGFQVRESSTSASSATGISVDVATCTECLAEMFDPNARRFGYAFTNCTNCGPRFTISKSIPYDRANTTMAPFEMCRACRSEYEDPSDRRFHAQPIACPDCGPQLKLIDAGGTVLEDDPIERAAALLLDGCIVALKGLGGFHLACDAGNESAVVRLRRRKGRDEKPFAVMANTFETACRLATTTAEETMTLASRARPIVLVERRDGVPLAASVAPGNRYVGLMLPYTPLHHLLMRATKRPLVMTSGNVSEEPIAYRDEEALDRLGHIADAFLVHDRPIYMRCDDSVVRVLDGKEYPIRRSRGYAPAPLLVSTRFDRPIIGAGPELKHTFCLGVGDRAIPSHHIGDLKDYETMRAFTGAVEHYTSIFRVAPEVVAHDLHPQYLSTKWALESSGLEPVGVQHHHAHIASCLADNGRFERVIGLALDGAGLGNDGAIWGGEILVCDTSSFERVVHIGYVPLPGGDAATREPWRMAAVHLSLAFGPDAVELPLDFVRRTGPRWTPILQMAERGINSPKTSSAGRLFDAIAALCGIRDSVSYEGQAAAELEQLADPDTERSYPCWTGEQIDGVALVAAAAEDLISGTSAPEVAAAFHNGLARALVDACRAARDRSGVYVVALSGGTWQNLVLLQRTRTWLESDGFEVLVHRRVPTNDGGISLGQVVVAGANISDPTTG